MFYYLFQFFEENYQLTGAGVFNFISFRASLSIVSSLLISIVFGKYIISYLQKQQLGEQVRDLGLEGQVQKAGTPTMGGLIIILATLVPVLLFAKLHNIYIILLLISLLWMGVIGFIDDYLKIKHKNKDGLAGKFKILGQIGLGMLVGTVMYFHPEITIKEATKFTKEHHELEKVSRHSTATKAFLPEQKSTKTTLPFIKDNELDYSKLITCISEDYKEYTWLVFIPIVIFIVTAVSNGANLTDGLDGLAAGVSSIMVVTLGLFVWVSGNIIFSDYLNIMYIPRLGEMTIFIAAFAGALVGFLWYNAFPAQVFMGDTGSLTIGGVIAVLAIVARKELLIPLLCGVFLLENLSVVLQVTYFKYTKKRFGEGKRIFLMSPLHHHYQKKGIHESKIVTRFWILGVFLAVATIVTLKLR